MSEKQEILELSNQLKAVNKDKIKLSSSKNLISRSKENEEWLFNKKFFLSLENEFKHECFITFKTHKEGYTLEEVCILVYPYCLNILSKNSENDANANYILSKIDSCFDDWFKNEFNKTKKELRKIDSFLKDPLNLASYDNISFSKSSNPFFQNVLFNFEHPIKRNGYPIESEESKITKANNLFLTSDNSKGLGYCHIQLKYKITLEGKTEEIWTGGEINIDELIESLSNSPKYKIKFLLNNEIELIKNTLKT